MKIFETKDKRIVALRILLCILTVCAVGFIFSNSLKAGEQSSQQSSQVVDAVQEVVGAIDPDSPIATATGKEYDKLHSFVRKCAHFSEFALLGFFLCCTYFSFFKEKKGVYLSMLGVVLVASIDESLQLFVDNRGASIVDVALDSVGGVFGVALGGLLVFIIHKIIQRRKKA